MFVFIKKTYIYRYQTIMSFLSFLREKQTFPTLTSYNLLAHKISYLNVFIIS